MTSKAPSIVDLPMEQVARTLGSGAYPLIVADDIPVNYGQDTATAVVRGGVLYQSSSSRLLVRTTNNAAGDSTGIRIATGTASGTRGDIELDGRVLRPPAMSLSSTQFMTLGSVGIVLAQNVTNASGDVDYILPRGMVIFAIRVVKTTLGGAGDQIVVKSTAATIATLDLNVAAGAVVNATSINPTNKTIAAGGILRLTKASATNCDGVIFINAIPTEL